MKRRYWLISAALPLFHQFGCAVGQPPGQGRQLKLTENITGAEYWLYLPEDYVVDVNDSEDDARRKSWPLVVTFHGMKPFDDALGQIREWQQEADRYGFIVCAPLLRSCDLFGQFPITKVDDHLRVDERNSLAIMNAVQRDYDIDSSQVLATSWSSGGYLAHYMSNRHPQRFTCVAVRQSNFNSDILDPALAATYKDRKIGIFNTQNDFKICKEESAQAAEWYARLGYEVTYNKFAYLGHERLPGPAAWFFAEQFGIEANSPSPELARMQVREIPPIPGPSTTPNPTPPRLIANDMNVLPAAVSPDQPAALPNLPEATAAHRTTESWR
jgi:predicted esterase